MGGVDDWEGRHPLVLESAIIQSHLGGVEFAGIRDFRLYGFFEQTFPMKVGTPDIYCLMWSNANPGSRGAKAPT